MGKVYINKGKTIKEVFESVVKEFPERIAFRYKVNKVINDINYRDLAADVKSLGTWIMNETGKQSLIGLIGDNSFYWYKSFLAVESTGMIAVPFDKGLTVTELLTSVRRVDLKIFFYDEKHAEMIEEVKKEFPEIRYVLINGKNEELTALQAEGRSMIEAGDRRFDEVVVTKEDLAVYVFTSGTTDMSKIVVLSNDNIASNVRAMMLMGVFKHEIETTMAFLPFHHTYGLVGVLVFIAIGGTIVFCDGLKYIQKNLQEYKVTCFVGVPLLVENIYKKVMAQVKKQGKLPKLQKGIRISNLLLKFGIDMRKKLFKEVIDALGGELSLIISGASALDPDAAKGLNDIGITCLQGYGLTETSPVLTNERFGLQKAGSVGIPLDNVEIKIYKPDEKGIGEILAKGPNVMLGYFENEEATNEVFMDGYFRTGDLGRIDKDGFLWICGRQKNVIVMKNGKNVFPEEIESHIDKIPFIKESLVYGEMKDHELTLWVKAVYDEAYMAAENLTVEDVHEMFAKELDRINDTMPTYKQVNKFRLTNEEMIKTSTNKIKRKEELKKDGILI